MIKGINKQILEVTNPESPYFEKIIFFVRPQSQSAEDSVLKSEAEKITLEMKKPPKSRRSKTQILSTVLFLFLGIGAGIATSVILGQIIG